MSPIFIQTEDGLGMIDCAKFPLAKSFDEVFQELVALETEPNEFKTIVIDSLDWLERLIWDKVAKDSKVDNIEQIGYGKGYTIALTFWRIVLDHLAALHQQGKIILLLAHAVAEDYSDPEVSSLKRFTPRLHKSARSLFAAKGDQNNPRIVRTEASPYQVAKSRFSIPAELPLDADAVLYSIKQAQNEANS